HVDTDGSLLITDEYKAYNAVNPIMRRAIINHAERYADGETHTNTIEDFWSLVKRAWFGSHHHYSRKYLPLFMAESCWKYNHRDNDDAFGTFLRGAMA
uniref:transposase n=1 Tax=Candidatus Thiosymbion oneisti TaxID=589554 RepID=UPI001414D6D7